MKIRMIKLRSKRYVFTTCFSFTVNIKQPLRTVSIYFHLTEVSEWIHVTGLVKRNSQFNLRLAVASVAYLRTTAKSTGASYNNKKQANKSKVSFLLKRFILKLGRKTTLFWTTGRWILLRQYQFYLALFCFLIFSSTDVPLRMSM